MNRNFDRRLTPARPDLAAEHLRGEIEATRYVAARAMRVAHETIPVIGAPARDRPIDTQALYGEVVDIYEIDAEGWAWGQLRGDGYVGYMPEEGLRSAEPAPTHRVRAPRTFIYPGPDMKLPPIQALPLGAEVVAMGMVGAFAALDGAGFVWADHMAPLDHKAADFVAVAEQFLNVPYLWGGKTFAGLDCSGLVQVALAAAGVAAPRDTDMMQAALGREVVVGDDLDGLARGDLVFWKGHVGVMSDARHLLHANGHHMMVARESLREARDRILAKSFGRITTVRRFGIKSA